MNDNPANLVDPSGLFSAQDTASDVYEIAKQILNDPCWKTHIFCPHPALHWKNVVSLASRKIGACADSQTCTSYVGGGLFIAGAITGQPWLMGGGLGIMTYNDGRGCVNGSGLSCTFLAFDLVSAGAASYGSYGVRWSAAMPPRDIPAVNYMLQAPAVKVYNTSFSLGLSMTAGSATASMSTMVALWDQLMDAYSGPSQ